MKDGKIVYVGDDEGAKKFIGDKTDVIDLDGYYVTPGFIDVHNHVIASDFVNPGVNLSSAKSVDKLVKLVKECADANPDLEVIQGTDYRPVALGGRHPIAKELDKAVNDRPLVVMGNSAHDAVFNSFALEKKPASTTKLPSIISPVWSTGSGMRAATSLVLALKPNT